jgi:crotonobetainyl-CoA:carnitine CoA-transferase CaiB-like acyl-CoA transferase
MAGPLPTGRQACLGEHTEYVCKEILKLSDEEIAQLVIDEVLK